MEKGGKNEYSRVASRESISIHLNCKHKEVKKLTYSDWTMLTQYTNELVRNLLIVCRINRRNTCYYR